MYLGFGLVLGLNKSVMDKYSNKALGWILELNESQGPLV